MYSPAQGGTDEAAATNIVLTFDEHVAAGSGNIVLTPVAAHSAHPKESSAQKAPVYDSKLWVLENGRRCTRVRQCETSRN